MESAGSGALWQTPVGMHSARLQSVTDSGDRSKHTGLACWRSSCRVLVELPCSSLLGCFPTTEPLLGYWCDAARVDGLLEPTPAVTGWECRSAVHHWTLASFTKKNSTSGLTLAMRLKKRVKQEEKGRKLATDSKDQDMYVDTQKQRRALFSCGLFCYVCIAGI